ncbi:arginine--tRNA ligase [Liberiplasma polymorphum]|uniref:arginine--tRNA ligase n=1 Tax=Liberiplasma polymorphum TaxID=3374570 RepID=UPI0037764331
MNMKTIIETLVMQSLEKLNIHDQNIEIEVPNDASNGDFSTNIAMKLAKTLKKNPMTIAEMLVNDFKDASTSFKDIVIARPGFINFYVNKQIYTSIIKTINDMGDAYGKLDLGKDEHINIEFVSANPTGSLHIGHARGAAAGDSIARILEKAGYQITREFYVNDGGNQIHNLALSIDARYKQAHGIDASLPEDGYFGKEITALAESIKTAHQDRFIQEDGYQYFRKYGVDFLLNQLREDLEKFNVHFDVWFSEASLYEANQVEETLAFLKRNNFTYELEGAIWMKSSEYGDEKDRVLVKTDGSYTYILPDIAYHKNKLSRGFTKLIDILGGDHHGYVPRLKAAIQMVGGRSDLLDVELLQMVKVLQNGEEVKMSKRSGKAITLSDLIEDVGPEPIRYFFAMRSLNTHMDLDLDLALKESNENPVFYAQYAHARISSIFRQCIDRNVKVDLTIKDFKTLESDKALDLLGVLIDYPNVIEEAASKRIPHKITQYIQRLSTALHSFYASEIVITQDLLATQERLAMLNAVKIVLKDALSLVGVHAKERM